MLVSSVAGSSLQGQWVVPQHLYDTMANKSDYKLFEPSSGTNKSGLSASNSLTLVEFATAADAKAFSAAVGCGGSDCQNKPRITYFGSNSVLIDDLIKGVTKVLSVVVLVIAAVSALIMMGMVGRVIGDSRRETAVFRAIGARRNDIRAIYTIYTSLLSLIVAAAALIIGVVLALWADVKMSALATAQAQIAFIGSHEGEQFRLIGIWWQALLAILIVIILTGLFSMLIPLSRNLGRSPIKDMRDDT